MYLMEGWNCMVTIIYLMNFLRSLILYAFALPIIIGIISPFCTFLHKKVRVLPMNLAASVAFNKIVPLLIKQI